ncbi:MAG: bifunctional GTP diphosphokinase/guanosine-3',5'-bis pyrophosphate 3'-pyrophosphohydrolase [Gammaproteobacteria bacterium]|nr:bifunctional GTP diphosphokinase/guanosine-3',5'-bis pyrophosphate 3'-pyrophosphohydrolase [Gammaproteobacteria bacterium]MDH5799553.1 bifunctional GTP diphosphokinase/guanosine-3',5'-bis pyrophosphate 3'-pyrophosphohydrolase [Gammaproteobacteria bacterium]
MFLISDLCSLLDTYIEADQVKEVYRAYVFSAEAHEGQKRLSGEPYIYHPLAVARILAEMRMDTNSIIAALLHDVIEDTPTAKDQLANEFNQEVADLVDGVSKLTQVKFESKAEAQAENFRKMMLAMAQDIRVILIKLADRLHNMRTLGVMRADKRRRISHETLEIYVPIAHRLGMNTLRLELEDLGFKSLYPLRYRILDNAVKKARGHRKEVLEKIRNTIKERLHHENIDVPVYGREKHLYSIYEKMRSKHLTFAEVFDVYAFRIIVDRPDTCYRVLGMVHNLYKPVPGKFKDYIAIPKTNGYQSIHTVLFGPYGVHIEVQIRTEDMDKVANVGVAAHWLYKSGESQATGHSPAQKWVRTLLEMQQNAGNSQEFLENVKIDLFPDEVYVFTPQGDIMTLPRGSTIVDFAYAVHSDLGNSCVAGKIDRRLAPLRTELLNGQTVEIISAPGARPNPLWLDFVVSAKARSNIRSFLKQLKREEAVELGRRMLEKALVSYSSSLETIPQIRIQTMLEKYKLKSLNDLLEQISLGNRVAMLVARQLAEEDGSRSTLRNVLDRYTPWRRRGDEKPLAIRGTEGTVVTYAKCCKPIPGDPILGFISAGRGIVIHVQGCKNIKDYKNRPDKWVDVLWEPDVEGVFPVDVRVDTANRKGVLATIAAVIAEHSANIENVTIEERDGRYSSMNFTISVKGRKHLADIIRNVRVIDNVLKINRNK